MSQARTWTLGLVVVIILIVIAGWQLGISPIVSEINLANSQAATIQTSNTTTESQLANLKLQYAHIHSLRKKLKTLRLSIPEQAAASAFIDEVTALATDTGVTVQSVSIAPATVYGASGSTDSSTSTATSTSTPAPATTTGTTTPGAATAPASSLIDLGVTVDVSGPYSGAQDFVADLQTGSRLFVVNTMSLTGSGGTSATGIATLSGNIFALQGTSDSTTSGSAASSTSTPTPYPTLSPTPTETATPTPTATSSSKSGSSTKQVATPTPTPTNSTGS